MTLQDLLVEHSSPTLAGIKCASLVNLSRLDSHSGFPGKELRAKGLSFMSIRTVNGTSLLLVYRKEKIGKLKSSIVNRGVSEETAESKAEETYKKRVLSKAVETVQEKFEQEKKAIEEEIKEKQAALDTLGK